MSSAISPGGKSIEDLLYALEAAYRSDLSGQVSFKTNVIVKNELRELLLFWRRAKAVGVLREVDYSGQLDKLHLLLSNPGSWAIDIKQLGYGRTRAAELERVTGVEFCVVKESGETLEAPPLWGSSGQLVEADAELTKIRVNKTVCRLSVELQAFFTLAGLGLSGFALYTLFVQFFMESGLPGRLAAFSTQLVAASIEAGGAAGVLLTLGGVFVYAILSIERDARKSPAWSMRPITRVTLHSFAVLLGILTAGTGLCFYAGLGLLPGALPTPVSFGAMVACLMGALFLFLNAALSFWFVVRYLASLYPKVVTLGYVLFAGLAITGLYFIW